VGVGLTFIVKVEAVPWHAIPFEKVGVTLIEAVRMPLVVLVPVKEGIFPFPDAASPIEGVLLTQA
jgi:hypothetical protein